MAKDQQGLTLAGSPESAAAFDRAIADYYGLTGDPVGILRQALARDPDFALGGAAIAALYMIGGFRGDHPEVVKALGAAEPAIRRASERERRISPPPPPGLRARPRRRSSAGRRFWSIIRPTRSPCGWLRTPISFSADRSPSATARRGSCRPGTATIRSRASSSAFTPSGSRRRATSRAPRTSAARRWRGTRATPGRRMRWPT